MSRLQVWWNGFFALILHTAGDPNILTEPLIRFARSGGPNLRIYEVARARPACNLLIDAPALIGQHDVRIFWSAY
jgi:hypothetical protein